MAILTRRVSILVLVAVVIALFEAVPASADEVTLFTANEIPIAYVADDLTIYLWSGEPVAYLEPDTEGGHHLYGFNGKHLGWYVSGVVRDENGYPLGARKGAFASGAFASSVLAEPFKAFKQLKPPKAFKALAPVRPSFIDKWSQAHLAQVLMKGQE